MIHNDHLATPQKMTDASGVVVWSAEYKPFGEATVNPSSTITNNLRFPGQYYDAETGLHNNYFRDYNPVVGRYVQSDPMGLTGGLNLYRYVQNPISFVDPLGLFSTSDFWNQYLSGTGAGIDLETIGLLNAFQNSSSVQRATNIFAALVSKDAQQNAQKLCGSCPNGTKSVSFSVKDKTETDVTGEPDLLVVGNSTFFRSAQCKVSANCAAKQYSFSCTQKFSIKDKFKDPFDYWDVIPGEIELPFAKVYPITASWTQALIGAGRW